MLYLKELRRNKAIKLNQLKKSGLSGYEWSAIAQIPKRSKSLAVRPIKLAVESDGKNS